VIVIIHTTNDCQSARTLAEFFNAAQLSITLISLFLVSHFNLLFIPRGRLSWLPVSFILRVKYTLSYRIVSYSISKLDLETEKAYIASVLYYTKCGY